MGKTPEQRIGQIAAIKPGMDGHMRVGLVDNVRAPNGDPVKGNDELVD